MSKGLLGKDQGIAFQVFRMGFMGFIIFRMANTGAGRGEFRMIVRVTAAV